MDPAKQQKINACGRCQQPGLLMNAGWRIPAGYDPLEEL